MSYDQEIRHLFDRKILLLCGFASGGEGTLEFAGILEMFVVAYGETVGAVELGTCTEIDVAVLVGVEDSIDTGFRRHIDRCRRETGILVCIVRRIDC